VVDDEAIVRSVARTMLMKLGCTVETAANGLEALEIFRKKPDEFDCVLLDLSMPIMDGGETLQEIHAVRSSMPVILSSGYSRHDTMTRPEYAGNAGFLGKPFQADEMLEILKRALNKSDTA
jgi:DNA-binding NtrC family response regulator